MKLQVPSTIRLLAVWGLLQLLPCASYVAAAPWDPAAADYAGRKGVTLYVSEAGRQLRRQQLAEGISYAPGGPARRAG